jgi:hypothetical protein
MDFDSMHVSATAAVLDAHAILHARTRNLQEIDPSFVSSYSIVVVNLVLTFWSLPDPDAHPPTLS